MGRTPRAAGCSSSSRAPSRGRRDEPLAGRLQVLIVSTDARLAGELHRQVWRDGHVASYADGWEAVRRALEKGPAPDVTLLDARMLPAAPEDLSAALRERRLILLGGQEGVPEGLASAPRLPLEEGAGLLGALSGLLSQGPR